MAFMISDMVTPPVRWSIASTCAVLLPSRGPVASFALPAFFALGAFLAGVVFALALPLVGATRGFCGATAGFLRAVGFAGSASGSAVSPSPWMRFQMRLAGGLGALKASNGGNPAGLL